MPIANRSPFSPPIRTLPGMLLVYELTLFYHFKMRKRCNTCRDFIEFYNIPFCAYQAKCSTKIFFNLFRHYNSDYSKYNSFSPRSFSPKPLNHSAKFSISVNFMEHSSGSHEVFALSTGSLDESATRPLQTHVPVASLYSITPLPTSPYSSWNFEPLSLCTPQTVTLPSQFLKPN